MKVERQGFPRAGFFVLLLIFGAVGVALFSPFVPALLWATVLSILTLPICRAWERRLAKYPRINSDLRASVAALMATLFTLVIILVPFLAIGGGIYLQFSDFVRDLSGRSYTQLTLELDRAVSPLAAQFGAGDFRLSHYLTEHQNELLDGLRQPLARFAGQAGVTIFTVTVALLTQFFMLRDGHRLRKPVVALIGLPEGQTQDILARVAETVRAVFIGTVLVALIQGAVIGAAYFWAGVPNALILGVISAILCIIPLLGAPVVYIPIGLLLLAQGNIPGAVKVLAVGFLVVSQIDNVLKPFLIGGRANLHPIAIFFSILGGVLLVGPIGVMAGPMALTILLALIGIVLEHIKSGEEPAKVQE